MKDSGNTSIDFEWKAIEIAKEITIAKLNNSAPGSSSAESGKYIGEMFLSIHEEVKKVFNKE